MSMSLIQKFIKIVTKALIRISKKKSRRKRPSIKVGKTSSRSRSKKKPTVRTDSRIKRDPLKKVSKLKKSKVGKPRSKTSLMAEDKKRVALGEVTHYFQKIKVCVIRIDSGVLKKGERISLEDNSCSATQIVDSMQIENEDVVTAKQGQLIGLKVKQAVNVGAKVYKIQT